MKKTAREKNMKDAGKGKPSQALPPMKRNKTDSKAKGKKALAN